MDGATFYSKSVLGLGSVVNNVSAAGVWQAPGLLVLQQLSSPASWTFFIFAANQAMTLQTFNSIQLSLCSPISQQ